MALLLIYLGYLFAGALIFYFMEHSLETQTRAVQLQERIKINGKWLGCTDLVSGIILSMWMDFVLIFEVGPFIGFVYTSAVWLHISPYGQ